MEALFGNPAYGRFVLQDHKRLPSRFFPGLCDALDHGKLERDAGGKPAPTFPHPASDHDDFGSSRSKIMNVIGSNMLERDAGGKPAPTFPYPAPAHFTA